MKLSVTLFVDSSLFGGIESHIIELSQLLMNNGIPVTVLFCKDRGNHQFYAALKQIRCPYNCLNGHPLSLYQYLKQNPDTLIHSHGYRAGITARLTTTFLRRPCVSTYHAGESGQGRVKLYNWLDKATSRLSNNLVVSQVLKTQVNKAKIMDNFVFPITTNKRKSGLSSTINVAFVGRLSYEKGPDIFKAVAEYCLPDPNLHFNVFGSGPMEEALSETKPTNLTLHGHQTDKSFWSHIDLLLISSRQEGLPMVLLEAMNRGIPVISTPVGAVSEVIRSGKNGFISSNRSAEALLACTKQYLSLSLKAKQVMTAQAQKTIHQDFSGDKQLNQLLSFYYSALRLPNCPTS